jgi:hypothetical protein
MTKVGKSERTAAKPEAEPEEKHWWRDGYDDPDFKGSIFESMGFDKRVCGRCGAHLKNGICLNACHLPLLTRLAFQGRLSSSTRKKP